MLGVMAWLAVPPPAAARQLGRTVQPDPNPGALRRLEDFPGHHEERAAPHPPGGESTRHFLRIAADVEVRLRADRVGGQFCFAAAGVTVELRRRGARRTAAPARACLRDPGRLFRCPGCCLLGCSASPPS
jgi:hypothetical protein